MNPLKAPQVATDEPSAKQILSTIDRPSNKDLKDAMIVSVLTKFPLDGPVRQVVLQAIEKVDKSLVKQREATERNEVMNFGFSGASGGPFFPPPKLDIEREEAISNLSKLQECLDRVRSGDSVVPLLYGKISEVAKAVGEQVLKDLSLMVNDPRGQRQAVGQEAFKELALPYNRHNSPLDGAPDLAPTNRQPARRI